MITRGLKLWALAELDGIRLALKRRFGKPMPLPEPEPQAPVLNTD